jgi:hypothetical protein
MKVIAFCLSFLITLSLRAEEQPNPVAPVFMITPEQIEALERFDNWELIQRILGIKPPTSIVVMPPNLGGHFNTIDNGGRGPGGGDVLLCSPSPENRFAGLYSYDYVQTRRSLSEENRDEYEFPGVESCLGYLDDIESKLRQINPVLASGLRDFIDALPLHKTPTPSYLRRWEPISYADGGLECLGHRLNDNTQIIDTPNCRRCQIIVRDFSEVRPQLLFTYDAYLLFELSKNPRQCSYTLIHEWARDFLPDSKDLYFFTRMLHEKNFHEKGEFDYQSMPIRVAQCLRELNEMPLDISLLEAYLRVVDQVPPTPQELERFERELRENFNRLKERLDERFQSMRTHRPLGVNEAQVEAMIIRSERMIHDLERKLSERKISYAEAYSELNKILARLPSQTPPNVNDPFLLDFLFLMDPNENPSRFE